MIGASAHEFGHALGIKAHSPYRDDIMHENRIVNQLSPADKTTIRNLYRSKPAYVM
jgi:predicted Zn-dependent protease